MLILPILSLALAWAVFTRWPRSAGQVRGWREALLFAAPAWGMLLVLTTEILTACRQLTRGPLSIAWGAIATGAAVAWFRLGRPVPRRPFAASLTLVEGAMIVAIGFIVIVAGVIAVVAPPNTWDSMTYHMSRVAHWSQNRSVAHYPTHIDRQIHLPPFAEWAILHAYVLWGGDRMVNMVQWGAMAGCLALVSLMAQWMGLDRRGQLIAALVCVTLPMGVLQASSTQNDYTAAFWLLCFACHTVLLARQEQPSWMNGSVAGASLGLALLTKSTAYLYGFPLVLWLVAARLRRRRRAGVIPLALAAAVCLAVNAGHAMRNARLYGSPMGPAGLRAVYVNDELSVSLLASNCLRHAVLHCGTPWRTVNQRIILPVVEGAHTVLGVDLSDSRITKAGPRFRVRRYSEHEDTAGSAAHLLLGGLAVLAVFSGSIKRSSLRITYAAALLGGALLFCAALKWCPFNVRLHLPLLVLSAPMAAILLHAIPDPRVGWTAGVLLVVLCLPQLLANSSRPILKRRNIFNLSREEQYFTNRQSMMPAYVEVCDRILAEGDTEVGLLLGTDSWEYPFWALLRHRRPATRLAHVWVTNETARKNDRPVEENVARAVIVVDRPDEDWRTHADGGFHATWSSGPVTLLRRRAAWEHPPGGRRASSEPASEPCSQSPSVLTLQNPGKWPDFTIEEQSQRTL